MKSLSQAKGRSGFPQKCKAYILPCFGAILRFYQEFNCKIYVWRWCEPNLIFPGNIYGAFSGKKKSNSTLPMWVFVAPKCWQNFWGFVADMDFDI